MDGIPFSSLRTRRKEDQTHRLSKVFNILPLSAAVRWAKKIKRTIRQTVFDFPILTIIMYRNQKIKDFSHSKHLLSLLSLRGEFVLVKLFSENSLFLMHLTCFITVILDVEVLTNFFRNSWKNLANLWSDLMKSLLPFDAHWMSLRRSERVKCLCFILVSPICPRLSSTLFCHFSLTSCLWWKLELTLGIILLFSLCDWRDFFLTLFFNFYTIKFEI